jgi:hypothetical protein
MPTLPIRLILNPWTLAIGAGLTAYALMKRTSKQGRRLDEAHDELVEQERTIARLRAELARARAATPPPPAPST